MSDRRAPDEELRRLRASIRAGDWSSPTAGLAPRRTQANLVVLPESHAYEFLLFCTRNPKPCPLLEVCDAGSPVPREIASDCDLRTDVPRYRVYRDGELVKEPTDVREDWGEDFVAFLIGCSFTSERALLEAGVPLRHVEQQRNVPMYRTSIDCRPAGRFAGPLVVSMRPMVPGAAVRAVQITSRFASVHGAPGHVGDPGQIGIEDLDRPHYGDAVTVRAGEVPVFWACGVTPQAVAVASRPPVMITHAPGHMFVTDALDEEQASF